MTYIFAKHATVFPNVILRVLVLSLWGAAVMVVNQFFYRVRLRANTSSRAARH